MTVFSQHARRALVAVALSAVAVPAYVVHAQTPPAAGQGAVVAPAGSPPSGPPTAAPHGAAPGQQGTQGSQPGAAAAPAAPGGQTAPVAGQAAPTAPGGAGAPGGPGGAPGGPGGSGGPGGMQPEQASPYSPLGTHLQQQVDIGRKPTAFDVRIQGQTALVHVGLSNVSTLSDEGIAAAKLLLDGLEHHGAEKIDLEKVKQARDLFNRLIPIENFGGEYTALAWFADYILGGEKEKKELAADPFLQQFFEMYANEDWKGLKEFLIRKYNIREMGDEWTKEGQRRKADLELTMLFNNPRREEWDQTTKAMKLLGVKPGMHIADIGSGAGYYTVKMAKLVGETGKVYAIETEEDRVTYVEEATRRLGLKNIENVRTDGNSLALGGRQVDMAIMVSLYHNIYAKSTARERNLLITDIRKSLKPDGRFVIIDNNVVAPGVVPYHSQYIAKELVVAQLVNYGFKLVGMHEYIPQRYMLEFQRDDSATVQKPTEALAPHEVAEKIKKGEMTEVIRPVDFSKPLKMAPLTKPAATSAKPVAAAATAPAAETPAKPSSPHSPLGTHPQQQLDIGRKPAAFDVRIEGQTSLVHVGLGDSFSLTEEGINAGKLMLEGLEHPNADKIDLNKIREARAVWERIIPLENFGGEYTALAWFADYILGGEKEKQELATDPFLQQFFALYAEDDWKGLKEFLIRKYHIREMGDEWTKEGQRRKADLELTILFNNPRREEWDHTTEALKRIGLKPGMHVADVGSGAGYYTVKMAKMVGETGTVYAIETEEDRVAYVEEAMRRLNLKNIENVHTDGSTLALKGRKVDLAIMVSLYHVIYANSSARERNTLVHDIRDSLKPDGRLIIIDNNVVAPGIVPYHGPYIAKELVVAQIVNYGFKLVRMYEYIPQRYVLEFQRDDSAKVQAPAAALAPHQVAELLKKGGLKHLVAPVSFAKKIKLAPLNPPAAAAADAGKAADTKKAEKKKDAGQ